MNLLADASTDLTEGDELDGETAFKLYDTYGFPLDLTQDALRQRGISVDDAGFKAAMDRQKAEARANWSGSGDAATETIWLELRDKLGATDFLGYDTESAEGVVLGIVVEGKEVDSAKKGDTIQLVVNQTPFYGESGGQVGDTGLISADGLTIRVSDTQKKADGLFVHSATVEEGTVAPGTEVALTVDHDRRSQVRANHSATHLLHEALREVLGTHVAQKGSLVAPDRLRFDISHPKPMSAQEISKVEDIANGIILQNSPVTTRLMAVDDAIAEGAMALFGEKYGDEVRVVSMGTAQDGEKAGKTYSVELCGGTHVGATGDIGLVQVIGESAVAAGVRRLEALTGEAARHYLTDQDSRVKALATTLRVQPGELVDRVDGLLDERKRLEREINDLKKALAMGGGAKQADATRDVAGVSYLGKTVAGVEPRDLKSLVDDAKSSLGSGVVTLVGVSDEGKASVVVGVTDDLTDRFNAVDLVRVASAALGGKGGGGRPDMAQAGGPDAGKAEAALDAVADAMAT